MVPVEVTVVDCELLWLVVAELVAVVVAELEPDVVPVVVPVLVTVVDAELDTDVVAVEETVDVGVVDGDVISHPWKVPCDCLSMRSFNALIGASQLPVIRRWLNVQPITNAPPGNWVISAVI